MLLGFKVAPRPMAQQGLRVGSMQDTKPKECYPESSCIETQHSNDLQVRRI